LLEESVLYIAFVFRSAYLPKACVLEGTVDVKPKIIRQVLCLNRFDLHVKSTISKTTEMWKS